IVNSPRDVSFSTFIGNPSLLGSRYASSDTPAQRHPVTGAWMPADPSPAQLREAMMLYTVMPLVSTPVRRAVAAFNAKYKLCDGRVPRSVLLYGPHGSGKSHLVQAAARACGALLLNISAANVEGKFVEKGGAAKLLHMVFEVAKDPAMAPVIIYIDDVDKLLPAGGGGKKKAAGSDSGPGRFKKDLATYIKSLTVEHSALVIGCSSEPWEADAKALAECFDKFLYTPCPDYGTRTKLWRTFLQAALAGAPETMEHDAPATSALTAMEMTSNTFGLNVAPPWRSSATSGSSSGGGGGGGMASGSGPGVTDMRALLSTLPLTPASSSVSGERPSHLVDALNVSALSSVSNGYAAGSLRKAVFANLTSRRLERLAQRPLAESELLSSLARCPRVYADDNERFQTFTDAVT
ncbi:ATP-binding protein, partial [archaeon]